MRGKLPYVLAVCVALAALPAAGGETDQYLAWGAPIEDSAEAVNAYVNRGFEKRLQRINRRGGERLECADVPPRLYRYLFHGLLSSRLRDFLHDDPSVDRHPDDGVRYWRYLRDSVFRQPAFPFFMPMARTIRIGEVRMGIDKINHVFGFGRRYYNHYLRARRSGVDEHEAVRRAVLWGLGIERYFVGGQIDGILSYADLEANYQGMRLARDLCEAQPPHLVQEDGRWRLARPVDLRDYVNPRFDESYNPNFYIWWRWRQVKPELEREVCPRLAEPWVRRQFADYRRADRPSVSERLLWSHLPADHLEARERQSLAGVCPPRLVRALGTEPRPTQLSSR